MSSPNENANRNITTEVNMVQHHDQRSNEEVQPSGSYSVRDSLRVRKAKKKKKLKKKKKKEQRRTFYYDSNEGSEERVLDYEDSFAAMGSDIEKYM